MLDQEWYQDPEPEIGKAQYIRLVDIWLLGPAMVLLGVTGKPMKFTRVAWVVGGILTIVYNWQNYKRLEEARRAQSV